MKKEIVNGSLESGDVFVLITPIKKDGYELEIKTTVPRFKKHFTKIVTEFLDKKKVKNIRVELQDSGALDYVIEARLTVALDRFEAQ